MKSNNFKLFDSLHISIKVVVIYLIVGFSWILFSDQVLTWIVQDQEMINRIQTVKGFLYVFITGMVVYFSVLRFNHQQDQLIRELRIGETKFRTLLENLPAAIFQKDAEMVYRATNHEYLDYVGMPDVEIVGSNDFETFGQARGMKYRLEDQGILDRGEPIVYDERVDKEGEVKYYTVIKAPYYADNKLEGIMGIILDMTASRKRENEFRKLYTALDKSNYGVVITSPESIIEYANSAYEELTGYKNDELVGKSINMLRKENQPARIYQHIYETLDSGQTWKGELYNIRKNGATYWERNIIMPIIAEDGEIENYIALKEDITQEKELARKMKELEVLRDVIIDDSDVWVSAYNAEHKLVMWNHAAESITGFSSEEVMQIEHVFKMLTSDSKYVKKVNDAFGEIIRDRGSRKDIVIEIETKHGEERFISFEMKSLGKQNVFKGWIVMIGFDVTNRMKAELALKNLNEDLEKRVNERTEELFKTNEHLEQSMAELEESQAQLTEAYEDLGKSHDNLKRTQDQLIMSEKLAALGDLVASVAHEINTPLGIGVTLSTFLQEKHKELAQRFQENALNRGDMKQYIKANEEAIDLMVMNLHRASELVTSFKQVASDQSTLELRKFKVKEYIEETLISLRPRFRNTVHKIEVYCDKDMEIISYPGAVSQIVTNLVMNSLIHGFDGIENGLIEIQIRSIENGVAIDYQDNGKGISAADKQQVFKPFFTTKRNQGSTGLGLHIVYNTVVQLLKGNIELESDIGQGVKFMIEMPAISKEHFFDSELNM